MFCSLPLSALPLPAAADGSAAATAPLLQARAAYDEAARSGGGWWDVVADRVACAWGDAKCRVKETLSMSAVRRGGGSVLEQGGAG